MAKQYQNPCGLSNFQKATFSFWFRIPSSAAATTAAASAGGGTGGGVQDQAPFNWMGGIELLAFGQGVTDFRHTYYSSINIGVGDTQMSATFTTGGNTDGGANGVTHTIGHNPSQWTVGAWFSCDPLHSDPNPDGYSFIYSSSYDAMGEAMVVDSGHRQYGHQAYMISDFVYDVWHHLMVAVDLTADDTYGDFPAESFNDHVENVCSIASRGKIREVYLDKNRISGLYRSSADLQHFFTASPPSNWNTPPASTPSPSNVILNGGEFSIPSFTSASLGHGDGTVTFNPVIRYAEFQAWFGQFIDPSTQMSKFVTDAGRPVPTSTAAAAFGTQTLLFKGNKTAFAANLGTGGAFAKTGTINDFSPGP